MSGPLFEQYKDALRRGHAALLEGRTADAVAAYETASRIVPDRALPHTSMATALLQLGRRDDALRALDQAAAVAPDDEAALRARAGLLRDLGRDADAAADLEQLAGVLQRAGRRDDALRVARRSFELGPNDGRRELVWLLEADEAPAPPEADAPGEPGELASAMAGLPRDPELLVATAGDRIAAGELDAARDELLEAVAVHRAAGRPDAALDVCFRLLGIAPGDPAVHLAIANVQLDHGWQAEAADKLRLLLQLTSLTGDTQAAADAHALAAERLRDEAAAAFATG